MAAEGEARLRALQRLLDVAPETLTADEAHEEGVFLEALAMGLANGEGKAEMHEQTSEYHRLSTRVFASLIGKRIMSTSYRAAPGSREAAPPGSVLRVLQCVRLLLRHENFVTQLHAIAGATQVLGDTFRVYADLHLQNSNSHFAFIDEITRELASVFKKITGEHDHRWRRDSRNTTENETDFAGAHLMAMRLLSTKDPSLLASALVILRASLTSGGDPKQRDPTREDSTQQIANSDCAYHLLKMLREYSAPFDAMAGDVLRQLLVTSEGLDGVRLTGGVRTTLEMLSSSLDGGSVDAQTDDSSDDDAHGKTSLALSLLSGILKHRACVVEARGRDACGVLTKLLRVSVLGNRPTRLCQTVSALAELAADDDGGEALASANTVFWLGKALVMIHGTYGSITNGTSAGAGAGAGAGAEADAARTEKKTKKQTVATAQRVFRALRFIFACERARVRSLFKLLFPQLLFEMFIDVGHYQHEIGSYVGIAEVWVSLPPNAVADTTRAFELIDKEASTSENETKVTQTVTPTRVVRGYLLTQCLGEGAFGKVHKACRVGKQSPGRRVASRAIKEIRLDPENAKGTDELSVRADCVSCFPACVATEVAILQKLKHPNIVAFFEAFVEKNAVYIVMELATVSISHPPHSAD
jgi:hypothetical protein